MQTVEQLKEWIREHTPEGLGILVPISGGSDSALCFWLYNQVFPERTVGVYFGTNLRAEAWFKSVGQVRIIEPLPDHLNDPELLRWACFVKFCLDEKRVLIGPRNKTEHVFGTFSHASRAAFHLPLAGLWKSEILEMCEAIGVPSEIIASSRAADPVCGRTLEYVAIPFDLIDAFLQEKIGESMMRSTSELSVSQRAYLEGLYAKNSYKRELPLFAEMQKRAAMSYR